MFTFSLAFAVSVVLDTAVTINFDLGLKSYRQRVIGYDFPVAVRLWARFPYIAAKTEEITIMIIMVGNPNNDIYAEARVENKLHAVHVFSAVTMCRSVCGRPASVCYNDRLRVISVSRT